MSLSSRPDLVKRHKTVIRYFALDCLSRPTHHCQCPTKFDPPTDAIHSLSCGRHCTYHLDRSICWPLRSPMPKGV